MGSVTIDDSVIDGDFKFPSVFRKLANAISESDGLIEINTTGLLLLPFSIRITHIEREDEYTLIMKARYYINYNIKFSPISVINLNINMADELKQYFKEIDGSDYKVEIEADALSGDPFSGSDLYIIVQIYDL